MQGRKASVGTHTFSLLGCPSGSPVAAPVALCLNRRTLRPWVSRYSFTRTTLRHDTHGPNPSIVLFPDPWATPNPLQTLGLKKKKTPSATVAETGLSPFFPSKSSYLKFVFHVFHGAWFKARFTCDRDKSCPNTHLSLIGQYNPFLQGCNLRLAATETVASGCAKRQPVPYQQFPCK
jgi:hypothetical protein